MGPCGLIRCSRPPIRRARWRGPGYLRTGCPNRVAQPSARPDFDHRLRSRVDSARERARRRRSDQGTSSGFPAGLKRWHGATPTTAMTHIAIQESLNGKNVDWLQKVSDEQYRRVIGSNSNQS